MIREYALDPEVLSNWKDFRWFTSNFGCQYGRMISRFPSKWKSLVFNYCTKNQDLSEMQLRRIEIILFNMEYKFDKKFIKCSRAFDSNKDWIDNAFESSRERPFFAIISNKHLDGVLFSEDIDEYSERWHVSTGCAVNRSAKKLVRYFMPFFFFTTDILFVDAHFNPEMPRYYRAFRDYFYYMFSVDKKYRKIEIHTSNRIELNHFINEFILKFSRSVPSGHTLIVHRWQRIEDNENFHPRYLLTEIGGLSIEYGFDEGQENETTDIKLLSDEIYARRYSNLYPDSGIFNLQETISFSSINSTLSARIINPDTNW